MAYAIVIHELAVKEIAALRTFDQRRVINDVEEQLVYQPTFATRRRKLLAGVKPRFDHVAPVWELRVGVFRVFYDVDESLSVVNVRAVRRKEPQQRTEEIV